MLKFIVLFFAAFAVFSPLFLIGIRKYTGRRAKRALGANIASFFAFSWYWPAWWASAAAPPP